MWAVSDVGEDKGGGGLSREAFRGFLLVMYNILTAAE